MKLSTLDKNSSLMALQINGDIKLPEDFNLLQSDMDSILGWCAANYEKRSINKTKVISFSRKTNIWIYKYKLCQSSIISSDYIKETWENFWILKLISIIMSIIYFSMY
jgi:hypothetical protein